MIASYHFAFRDFWGLGSPKQVNGDELRQHKNEETQMAVSEVKKEALERNETMSELSK